VSHDKLRIGFIGGGNMAQAIVGGLLQAGHVPSLISISEPQESARRRLAALAGGLALGTDNAAVAGSADVLVLAVKPQVMSAVLPAIAAASRPDGQLVVSVAAGIPIATLAAAFGSAAAIVRIMPNQPALVGAGMSVLAARTGTGAACRARAQYVAETTGKALWIADESLMDAVTAVSGSGPAYFYLLMEVMEQTARELGLPADAAAAMVRQTALGAAISAGSVGADLAALRASVTSPGGTTAAALAVMDQASLRETVRRAIVAARDRGAELGRSVR